MEAIKFLENQNLELTIACLEMITKKVPLQMVFAAIKIRNQSQNDQLFNAQGVEAADVRYNVKALNLKEDDEYKAVIEEIKEKKKAALEGKSAEDLKKVTALIRRIVKKKGVKPQEIKDAEVKELGGDEDD